METIEDIVNWLNAGCEGFCATIAEEKIANPRYDAEACMSHALQKLASRIEAAVKRKNEAIVKMHAALEPVLAIPTDALTGLWGVVTPDGGMVLTPEGVASAMSFVSAVKECQRIYGEEDGQ